MKRIMQFLLLHPLVMVVYTMYLISWIVVLKVSSDNIRLSNPAKLYHGDGLMFLYFFMLIASLIYLSITLFQAVLNKKQRIFYLRLALLIVIPPVFITALGYL